MSSAFTEEQQNQIREQLFQAGIRLSKELGVQRMTISKLAAAVGIAKGSNAYEAFTGKKSDDNP